jgi:hypothetical protein
MKELMISIICTSNLNIAVKKHNNAVEMYGFKSSGNFETERRFGRSQF